MKNLFKKNLIFILVFLVSAMIIFSGCSSDSKNKMININNVSYDNLKKYTNTKITDKNKLTTILSNLPGNKGIKDVQAHDNAIFITYEFKKDSDMTEKEFDNYWCANDSYRKIFILNASVLYTLTPDLLNTCYTLRTKSGDYTFSVTRSALQGVYGDSFNNLAKKTDTLKQKINSEISSENNLNKIYQTFPVTCDR